MFFTFCPAARFFICLHDESGLLTPNLSVEEVFPLSTSFPPTPLVRKEQVQPDRLFSLFKMEFSLLDRRLNRQVKTSQLIPPCPFARVLPFDFPPVVVLIRKAPLF